ncbi:MAG: glycosyltransferase family 4 protein [Candidatus Omnitrophica bacterium]|nr:glycosyltransferase family 4 protein [Candidatus Omnitrophota bacterium]
MKISFVLPPDNLSGGMRVIATYAQKLKERGHSVFIAMPPRGPESLRQRIKSFLTGKFWQKAPFRQSFFDGLDAPRKVLEKYRRVKDKDLPDADVVIATWWETAEWVAGLSKSKGAKVYFIQHHEPHDYCPKDRVMATYLLPLHKITISKWLVDLMKTRYGDANVSLIFNSVDTKQFYAPPRAKQKTPTVGMMYSSIAWKGCDISLKAFSLAAQKIPNLRLFAFGNEAPSHDLSLPAGTHYFQQPAQKTIKNIYTQCDAWLFTSRNEGFGLPILEAMACRTPVIGTPAGAAPELLVSGGGILVKPEDPEDLARAIIRVCQEPEEEWKKMSEAAYKQATSYTWDDATVFFEQALEEIFSKRCLLENSKQKIL